MTKSDVPCDPTKAVSPVGESVRDQELRALVEGVREYAIFTVGTDGLISSWHPGAELIKGYSAEEAIGMPFAQLFTPEDRAAGRPEREMRIAAETGEYQGEGVRLRKNGETFEAAVVLTALRAPTGEVLGYLKLTQDISARRLLERSQREALDNAEAARAQAERTSQSMGEFLATISHELRTPLSAILGWATVLSRGPSSPQVVARAVEAIMRNAKVQIGLIEDLLDMNRIETGKLRVDLQPVDLSSVIAGAIEAVLPAARAKGVRLRSTLDAATGRVAGDSARLQQVVWNLLMNAVKFTPKGGEVTVSLNQAKPEKSASTDAPGVQINVADNGQGIDPAFLPYLFDRFRQQDASTTRRHGGLGIGLALVRQLTELHGGSVRAESQGVGRGASFTVLLPLLAEEAGLGATPAPPRFGEPAANEADRPLGGVTVLLVDDEADACEVASYVLGHAGARVLCAANAEDALSLVKSDRPDLLLSDIGMPGHDGYALLRWVQALAPEAGGSTPAIALTAYAAPEDRRRIAEAGYRAQLLKPVEPAVLVSAIADVLGDPEVRSQRAAL